MGGEFAHVCGSVYLRCGRNAALLMVSSFFNIFPTSRLETRVANSPSLLSCSQRIASSEAIIEQVLSGLDTRTGRISL